MAENQPSTEMASIESLAFETLSQISSLLCQSSMKSFRLVCHKFCDVVTPLIFNSIFVSARHLDLEISNLVALRFSDSIKTLTFSSVRHQNPEEEGLAGRMHVPKLLAVYTREIRTPQCRDGELHSKTANHLGELYCKLLIEALDLYKTGALHAHLCHLLDRLPKVRQIVITDKRRRQDVSWYQEALMDEKLLRRVGLSPANNPPHRHNRSPWLLSNLCNHWQDIMPQGSLGELRGWISQYLHRAAIRSPAEQPTLQSVGCHCFERDGDETLSWGLSSSLGEAFSIAMPSNPWSVIMTALQESKPFTVDAVFIKPRVEDGRIPIEWFIHSCQKNIIPTTSVLAHVTRLELRLKKSGVHSDGVSRFWRRGTPLLSAASNLQSLTVDFSTPWEDSFPTYHEDSGPPATSFEMFLGGCKLSCLSKLHLHDLTVLEEHLSAFLQESPELRDLSLKEVFMIESTPMPYPHTAPTPVDPMAWGRVLQTIKETLHQLQYFYLSDRRLSKSLEVDHLRLTRMIRHFVLSDGINPILDTTEFGLLEEEKE
ncbi:hypothetical protein BDR22DRAFT_703972 [Usnea florida]